ncbi:MAG: preprotein translocase subunit SecG [Rhodospirillales bacterium]
MIAVLLVIHVLLAFALVCVVLLQKSEGGGLGIGGGSMGGLMTTRGTANLLTRTTGILAACFMLTSMALAIFATQRTAPRSILDRPAATQPAVPQLPAIPQVPTVPAPPSAPSPQ